MNKTIANDWNFYRTKFPTRYWQRSEFDEVIEQKISSLIDESGKKELLILDVGGGIHGTEAIFNTYDYAAKKGVLIKTDFLDPFIEEKPIWSNERVTWTEKFQDKYDMVICRGSINYLSEENISTLIGALKSSGVFLSNTFLKEPSPNWSQREVINWSGSLGVERARLKGNIVEHEIVFKDYRIVHQFNFYSKEDFMKMIPGVNFVHYSKKSSYIFYRKA